MTAAGGDPSPLPAGATVGLESRFSAGNLSRALSAGLIFFGAVQFLAISLSLLRIEIGSVTAVLILLAAAVGAGAVARGMSAPGGEPEAAGHRPRLFWGLLLSGAVVYLLIGLCSLAMPDLSWDGNTYHLPAIHLWAARGYLHWIDPGYTNAALMNGYPKGVEVIAFILGRATGSTRFGAAGNWALLPLGVLGIASLSRRLGASARVSLAAGMAWMLVPVNLAQAVTSYVDSGFASGTIATVAVLVPICARLARHEFEFRLPDALTLGCACGLTMSGKSTGLPFVLIFFGILAALGARELIGRKTARPGTARRALVFLVVAVVVAAAVGGFWYGRNFAHTGSPFYPAGLTLAGVEIFPGPPASEVMSEARMTPQVIRALPAPLGWLLAWSQFGNSRFQWPLTIVAYDSTLGGLGFLWLAGCLPAITVLLYRALRGKWARRGDFLWLAVLVVVPFLVQPMNWWARYTAWIYALGLPALAVVATGMVSSLPAAGWIGRVRRVWLGTCVALALTEAVVLPAFLLDIRCLYDDPADDRYALRTKNPWKLLNPKWRGTVFERIFAGEENVAVNPSESTVASGDQLLEGFLSIPIGARQIVPLKNIPDDDDLRRIRDNGVVWVIWDDSAPLPDLLQNSLPVKKTYHPPGMTVLELEEK